jgi:hypothetical protein
MEVFFTRASEGIIWAQIRRGTFDLLFIYVKKNIEMLIRKIRHFQKLS